MFKKTENLLFILVINLLYPAVLGSIFYSVFGSLSSAGGIAWDLVTFSCTVMLVSVIIFFVVDYLYTGLHVEYGFIEFGTDLVLLFLLQAAFQSVNFLSRPPRPERYCLYMAGTLAIFLVWDWLKREGIGSRFRYIFSFELIIFGLYLGLAAVRSGFLFPAFISIVGATAMIGFFLSFYSSDRSPAFTLTSPDNTADELGSVDGQMDRQTRPVPDPLPMAGHEASEASADDQVENTPQPKSGEVELKRGRLDATQRPHLRSQAIASHAVTAAIAGVVVTAVRRLAAKRDP